jgi:hypothetical protein
LHNLGARRDANLDDSPIGHSRDRAENLHRFDQTDLLSRLNFVARAHEGRCARRRRQMHNAKTW